VDLRIGWVRELVGAKAVGAIGGDPARGLDGLIHTAKRLDHRHLSAVDAQQPGSLATHPLGHGQHQLIALGGADEGERDAGVARGRLDDRGSPGLDPSLPLGGLDHGHADPVLDRAGGVVDLELADELGAALGGESGEAHERRVPRALGDAGRDGLGRARERRLHSPGFHADAHCGLP
jgi:hypothetical protein